MSKGMDWRRSHYQTRIRDHGATDVDDAGDRAARWLNKVSPNATAPKVKRLTHKQFLATRTAKYLDAADPSSRAAIQRQDKPPPPQPKRKRNSVVVAGSGDPCPRCGCPTQIREHGAITDKLLAQPFYHSRWFVCRNHRCRTSTITPDRFRVFRDDQTRAQFEPEHDKPFSDVVMETLDATRASKATD
jgi:hypothetical protein